MAYGIEIRTKEVKPIIKATFPKYRKLTVRVIATEKVTFSGLNWSGGTISDYKACTIDGKPIDSKHDMSMPHPWNNPFEGLTIDLPRGAVVVESGFFCGHKRQIYIYVNPEDMPKWLE